MNKKIFVNIALTVASVAGIVATAILTAQETPKAISLIEESEKTKCDELTKFEKVQAAAPAYLPAIAVGAATIAAVVASNVLSVKEIASLTAAYALIDQSFKNYREKTVDIFGENADFMVRQAVSEEKHPEDKLLEDRQSEKMMFCFNDGTEDRFFESTLADVKDAEYEINRAFATEGIVSLSDFYRLLGLPDKNDSELLGWTDDMVADWIGYYWLDFDHRVIKSDDPDTPDYIEIVPETDPVPGYDSDEWADYMDHKYLENLSGVSA